MDRRAPDKLPVDPVVSVDQTVAHSGHPLPGNGRMRLAEARRKTGDGFTDDQQLTRHGPMLFFVRLKHLPVDAAYEPPDSTARGEDVDDRGCIIRHTGFSRF